MTCSNDFPFNCASERAAFLRWGRKSISRFPPPLALRVGCRISSISLIRGRFSGFEREVERELSSWAHRCENVLRSVLGGTPVRTVGSFH
ncbi:hypothetical protein CEXT_620241 [Caerostris extrusa]|uniref:Uncharacterized protein n=1 Tax=Caerostris extrusa TaxID=172846 RepID=A0AAV4WU67_CAEEX|nr:hypothetical protein CEXT_620241 [Caerostris extrusa]